MSWAATIGINLAALAVGIAAGYWHGRRRLRRPPLEPLPPWTPNLGSHIRSAITDHHEGL